jgi:translation initiation factor 5
MQELELRPHRQGHILSNLNHVCSSIGRTPELLIAFFDLEVLKPRGLSPCRIHENGVVVPYGIDQKQLQEKVFEFIRKCILCPICSNPETHIMSVQELTPKLELNCISCGAHHPTTEKLTSKFCDWMRKHKIHLRTVGERLPVERMMRQQHPDDFEFPQTDDKTPTEEKWDES